jgi:hypothetical protein
MIFEIKRLFLKDGKTILSKPNWVANDDKLTLIKKLVASLTDRPSRKNNELRIYIQTNFRTVSRETFWKHITKLSVG